jgi:beta-alanine degradation protein BauB
MMAGVGSNVVFENDKIKVWEFNLEPGEQTPVHTHDMDYIFYVINGTTLEVFDANNKFLSNIEVADGDVVPLRLEGDELVVIGNESQRIPATHSARNGGPNRYREILVETK